jgi:hypothetical protein
LPWLDQAVRSPLHLPRNDRVRHRDHQATPADAIDVFVTVDRKLPSQQDLNGLAVAVVALCARDEVAQENGESVQDGAVVRRAGGRSPTVCVVDRCRAVSANCAGGQDATTGDSDRRPDPDTMAASRVTVGAG